MAYLKNWSSCLTGWLSNGQHRLMGLSAVDNGYADGGVCTVWHEMAESLKWFQWNGFGVVAIEGIHSTSGAVQMVKPS